jgi:hypothetical protein
LRQERPHLTSASPRWSLTTESTTTAQPTSLMFLPNCALRSCTLQMLTAKEAPQVDQMIQASMEASPTAAWGITHGMYAMGAPTPRAYLAAAQDYNFAQRHRRSHLLSDSCLRSRRRHVFQGAASGAFCHLTCPKTFMRFAESEGAGAHCQVGAGRLAFARMYDWLDETFRVAERSWPLEPKSDYPSASAGFEACRRSHSRLVPTGQVNAHIEPCGWIYVSPSSRLTGYPETEGQASGSARGLLRST